MKKVKVALTGEEFEVLTNIELVTKLRNSSFTEYKTNRQFMIAYAKRAVIYKNEDIRATDENSFVNDLIKLKHLEVQELQQYN